jgi:hypothetical protein
MVDFTAFHESIVYPDYNDDEIFEASEKAFVTSSIHNCKVASSPITVF